MAADGRVTDEARQALEIRAQRPRDGAALALLSGAGEVAAGNPQAACRTGWISEADSPAEADWLPLLRRRIAESAKAARDRTRRA